MKTAKAFKALSPVAMAVALAVPALAQAACGAAGATLIHDVQGRVVGSPLQGKTVTVEGVVSGAFTGTGQLRGFYLQEEARDQDADPATSEGIFVFLGNLAAPTLKPGDVVRVTGKVSEYSRKGDAASETQITPASIAAVEQCAYREPLTYASLRLPLQSSAQLEALAGMAVRLEGPVYVAANYDYGRYGELTLSSQPRLWTATQRFLPGSAEAKALSEANQLDKLTLDDGLQIQNANAWLPAPGGLSASQTLRSGDRLDGVTGVVSYAFGKYRLQPLAAPRAVASNPRPGAPKRLPESVRFASFNVLNFFNGDGQGKGFPTPRGAKTQQDFERQRAKIVAAIRQLDADVVGLMEIENDGFDRYSAIQDLVNALNQGQPQPKQYRFANPGLPQVGSDAITTGLIYRPATVTAEGKAEVRVIGNPQKNRPALLQTFVLDAKSKSRVTVAVNHLKSKGSSCADQVVDGQSDVDKGDGQGNCNLTRVQAVRDLMAWYATRPQPGPNDGMLLLGDMNSYAKEDPIRAFESAGFNNLLARWSRDAYSYVFNGESGNLDHALADKALSSMVLAAGEWHINADEPTALEYSSEFKSAEQQQKYYAADAYRSSDHDPLYVDVARRGNAVAAADEGGLLMLLGLGAVAAMAAWRRKR
ncbi:MULTISPECIES: ExeM/NucH family extracellular endonuclease [unclassified Chromobacterium]|uniref:ExeM/NucH family extracellular endonuclease n=1 Tax=unclassified Chromobacterium TaxID=2641838 RepID=UPI00069F48DA|nr:ExeM/NucH family extracellular endonuclease [Chromobacterium sp. LK1]